MQGKIGQNSKVIMVSAAKDYNGAAATTEWICMKNCEKVRWVINCGVINASSVTAAVTLTQALSDGGTPVALAYTTFDKISGETVTATTAASTYTLLPADSGTCLVFEAKASSLTRTNLGSTSYDWVTINVATASAHSIIYSITAEVFGLKGGPDQLCLA